MSKDYLLVGVDGGATKVSAWEILYDENSKTFSLGNTNASKSYREVEDYIPNYTSININIQLNELATTIKPTQEEEQQAGVYIETCALAINNLVKKTGIKNVLIGLGMPGLKTEDKRGIAVLANGPRMTNYSEVLEDRLEQLGVKIVAPIAHLGSDADYCGIGENYSDEGLFRSTENAYYLGGGTGVADAMKLKGELLPFDKAKDWIAKTWEIKNMQGLPMERVTAVGGIQKTYAEISGKTVEQLNAEGVYPQQVSELALNGEDAAIKTFDIVNSSIAQLLYERIVTLNQGWQNLFEFVNPNKPQPDKTHPYLNMVFDKIIIGQRLGDLFESESGVKAVKEPVIEQLNELIQNSEFISASNKKFYSNLNEIIESSKLREAPALGAGIDAYFSKK
ncbi:MAG: hypothetical protein ABFS32_07920 [Bacteroidota bacterium]